MQVVIFDRQSIFIHGMKISLQEHIPGIDIFAVSQADDLWRQLLRHPDALLILDGEMDHGFCQWVLQEKHQQFPDSKGIIVVNEYNRSWLNDMMAYNVQAIIARDASIEVFVQTIKSVMRGLMCLPGDWRMEYEQEKRGLDNLSQRQREILALLANGESNKEISRTLNISAGTVKAHLESLYRRLDVKNRTQAAMLLNNRDASQTVVLE
ncbi:response regulator transcription factor [Kluyvera intermedia]|jgi:DNA-binding NarL/FixJ family response regulator|uniref:response regulator transcription factor n=1 Tax=Kluyvera intermedia TaxID=61648 RepID=UPI00078914DE|nr:response regulator transcription factor [Kluyvera intermedia]WEJ83721.1 MAG: response regulator transcription factor [Kluyvera intermedia]WQD29934.1 response regulator transcription factor [Kluyvera intermedia]